MSDLDLDFIASLIDRADIPKAEKAYLKAATETQGGIPDITGDRQHKAYGGSVSHGLRVRAREPSE